MVRSSIKYQSTPEQQLIAAGPAGYRLRDQWANAVGNERLRERRDDLLEIVLSASSYLDVALDCLREVL